MNRKTIIINGEPSPYEITECGRVFRLAGSVNCVSERELKTFPAKTGGYPIVQLTIGSKYYNKKVHRLVAKAFLPNPEGKRCVAHKDHDTSNPHASNLFWATHEENIRHSWRDGRMVSGETHGGSKLTRKKVEDIRKEYGSGGITQEQLGKKYGVTRECIGSVVNYKTWNTQKGHK